MVDPYARPLGYWSEQGEAWTEARYTASAHTVFTLGQAQRDLAQERQKVADLAAEEARATCRGLYPHQARQTGKETPL